MGIYPDEVTTFAAVVLYGAPVAVAVLSYLLGCINGAIATSHIFYHDDVRRHGSGNAGLTNFYRNYGAKCAPMVIAFDMLKAVGAVLLGNYFLGYLLGWGAAGKYFGALFCVIGHMFPVFYGFKGGKGILCSGTLLLLLDWRIALVGWGAFVVLWLTTRYVSLGSGEQHRSPRRSACRLPRISCSITRPAQCSARAFRFLCCGRTAATSKDS